MKLYCVEHKRDREVEFVIANSFADAVARWQDMMAEKTGKKVRREPTEIRLLHRFARI